MRSSVDLFQHVSMQMKVLDFFGLSFRIPYSKKSVCFWLRVLSRICIGTFVFVIPAIGQITYLIGYILSGKAEIQEVASMTNLVLTETLAAFKLLDMRLRRNTLDHLLDQFTSEEFSHSSEHLQVILAKAVRISRILFVSTLFSSSMDVLFHVVVVPGLNGFKTLPLQWDFIFFDVNDPKIFKYVYAYQILYKPWMVSSFVVMLSLSWASMAFTSQPRKITDGTLRFHYIRLDDKAQRKQYIVSQLDVLIYNFENIKELVKATRNERNCVENEAFRLIFKSCVLHHSAIKRFINIYQATFSWQLASSLIVSTGIIGTTALQFFSIKSPHQNITEVFWVLAYMVIFIGILFVDCWFGNSVTVKCGYLSFVIFASPWLNYTLSLKKNLLMFIAWTQQPVVITASKLIPVSLETFTKVMNWTYKGFAVLNQMK